MRCRGAEEIVRRRDGSAARDHTLDELAPGAALGVCGKCVGTPSNEHAGVQILDFILILARRCPHMLDRW
jgi:hypothetical protein